MTQTVDITNSRPPSAAPSAPFIGLLWDAALLRRAAVVAILLGTTLTFINQGPALLGSGDVQFLPLVLVYVTPFVVVALSQALGVRRAMLEQPIANAARSFGATLLSRGIPARAVALGAGVGAINAAIVGVSAFTQAGTLDQIPLGLLAQGFSLPIIFGAVSQTLAFRRAAVGQGRR